MQRLIILRGTPASGKSTIAKSYRNFAKKVIWLKVDNFKDFFGEDTEQQLRYAYETSLPVLEYLLKNGFSVIVDGIFRNIHLDILKQAVEMAEKQQIPYKIFQLTCPLQTLLERDRKRVEDTNGIRKPIGDDTLTSIYENLKNNPYPNAIVLNTEEHNLDECKQIIDSSF